MKRKILALGLIATLLLVVIAGCTTDTEEPQDLEMPVEDPVDDTEDADTEDTEDDEDTADGSDYSVGLVTDEGGVNDESFNQSAYEGLERASDELGVEIGYQESNVEEDFAPNLEILLDAGNDLIWGVGFMLHDAVLNAAQNNPDTFYALVDEELAEPLDNAVSVLFKQEQPSFLVGYIAGMMTETNQVGFVGGVPSQVIANFEYGYRAGVQYAADERGEDIEVVVQYAESFTDATLGRSIATNMYQQGADVIFHAAGGVGAGVIGAAADEGKWVIGVDMDQHEMAPDVVITSAMKEVGVGVYDVIEQLVNGSFPAGETVVYGLEEGAVDIAPTSDVHVPQDILDSVEELKQLIIDEEIVVPTDEETYDEFMDNL